MLYSEGFTIFENKKSGTLVQVGVIGISHKSSDLTLREKVARVCVDTLEIDHGFSHVLLTTCNRTEIYFSAQDLAETHSILLGWLRAKISVPFEHKLYSYFGIECFAHIAKVSSGLDSLIVAETEIQGQVKKAYAHACQSQVLPSCMHYMFQKALKISKAARGHLPIGSKTSLERLLFQLAHSLFEKTSSLRVLFVGNSQINRKIFHYFQQKGIINTSICTHRPTSPECIPWSELCSWPDFPLVICGTCQNNYTLHPEEILNHKAPLTRLICDLSMPRTVDPRLAQTPHILLMNLDDLGSMLVKQQNSLIQEKNLALNWLRHAVENQNILFHKKTEQKTPNL